MTDIPIRPSSAARRSRSAASWSAAHHRLVAAHRHRAVLPATQRFVYGLGAVTNINNGYPWGIWVVWDVVIATGFACGGYAMALAGLHPQPGRISPADAPALTASLFGYSLGGLSVLIDLGRYWNFWHILSPAYFNPGSVMFEVAVCISLYIVVLWIECLARRDGAFRLTGMRKTVRTRSCSCSSAWACCCRACIKARSARC